MTLWFRAVKVWRSRIKNLKRCGGSDIHSLPVNGAGAIIADQIYEFDYAGKEVTKRLPAPHPGAQGFNITR
jgi:hypothetical protein